MENLSLQILEENKPSISANFEQVKENLQKHLKDYSNLVVTEESLSMCKAARGDLATLHSNIDKKRKEIKRDFSQPIVEFETKCKELIELIDNVKGSIDEGIKVFDDKTREEKRQYALKCIEEISVELELEEDYKKQIQLLDRYMNLTITRKEVKEDIRNQATVLKGKQDFYDSKIKLAFSNINLLNETYKLINPLSIVEFMKLIDGTDDVNVITESIKNEAQKRKEIEEKTKQQEKERLEKLAQEEAEKEKAEIQFNESTSQEELEQDFTITINLTASNEKLNGIRAYLTNNNIKYKMRIEQ